MNNMENTSANPELEDEPVQNDDPVQENEVIALDGLGRTMILICMVYDEMLNNIELVSELISILILTLLFFQLGCWFVAEI